MIVSRIRLRNWMCFRGEHELVLGPKAYAVLARREGDGDRSNWQGKTSLLEAVRFALYGAHRHRLEDGWITKGEPDGSVEVQFDTGLWVDRGRKRGKSTLLSAGIAGGKSSGGEAEGVVQASTGLSLVDFEASCYFGQRETARLVNADPGERMKVVEGWLQLSKLRAAEDRVAARAAIAEEEIRDCVARLSAHRALLDASMGGATFESFEAGVAELAGASNRSEEAYRIAAGALREAEAEKAKQEQAAREIEAYRKFVELGTALAAEVSAMDFDDIKNRLLDASEAHETARTVLMRRGSEVQERRTLVHQGFNGVCPVDEHVCPVRAEVSARVMAAKEKLSTLESKERIVIRAEREACRLHSEVAAELREAERKAEDLERLRAEAVRQGERVESLRQEPVDLDAARAAYEEARREDIEHRERASVAVAAMRQAIAARREISLLEKALAMFEGKRATLAAAAKVLGRRGVRRLVAAPFLDGLGMGANAALASCGVDLSVGVKWEHEGKDPARACEECGRAFPVSAKVKACERCGAPRGRHLVERLEFELSDRSAAAEDLAGIALQLAASAYLREARGCALEMAMLDEPLGACDKHHRREMARAFVAMLSGFGYRQSLVVAHDAATQGSFPGVVLVTGGDKGSRVEVVQ